MDPNMHTMFVTVKVYAEYGPKWIIDAHVSMWPILCNKLIRINSFIELNDSGLNSLRMGDIIKPKCLDIHMPHLDLLWISTPSSSVNRFG